MKNILCLNKIAPCGTEKFDKAAYNVGTDVQNPDAIMVRSAVMHEMAFGDNLLAIARAGAGVNNIPIDRCSAEGIVVFNTPGANANGVKELAICALMLASRKITDGVIWAASLKGTEGVAKAVEAGKSKFEGCEIKGKTLGVIGLGAIGGMVASTATHLGMDVVGCDPYLTVEAAWNLSSHVRKSPTYADVFVEADYITLHVPATPQTKNMINAESIATMKDGVRIINLSRADLVNEDDILAALESGKVAAYVTDFPTDKLAGAPGVVAIPHLGASTEESEDNCAVMAARELDDYLRFGNITNSVNFPAVSMPHSGDARICVLHANIPATIAKITTALSDQAINIENMISGSRKEYGYAMFDLGDKADAALIEKLGAIENVIRIRVI